jgi:hypothetical protein
MDAVNSSVLHIQLRGVETDESAALLRAQENFTHFGRIVSRDEGDLACGSQIISAAAKALELNNATIRRFANITCNR